MRLIFFTVLIALAWLTSSCKTTTVKTEPEEKVLFTIDDSPVTVDEFKYVYEKNKKREDSAYSEQDIRDYLDLFVDFKLKVKEAYTLGMDKNQKYIDELEKHRSQLAKPYLSDQNLLDSLSLLIYKRMGKEIKASHILRTLSQNPTPADTLAQYNYIKAVRDSILAGGSFEEFAIRNSQDPSVISNKGSLGYFTAFDMIAPFEDAAFTTPVGEVSEIVRTKFGYHILKVFDKRENEGMYKMAHILIFKTNKSGRSIKESIALINKIHSELKKDGSNWDELVLKYSEDQNSKQFGGVLPPIKPGIVGPEFDEVASALSEKGEISAPVPSRTAFHILKFIEKIPKKPYKEMEAEIKSQIKRSGKLKTGQKKFIEQLKITNKYKPSKEAIEYATSTLKLDSASLATTNKDSLNMVLFRIGDDLSTKDVNDYIAYLKTQTGGRINGIDANTKKVLFENFVDQSVLAYEEAHLSEKYLDYKMLYKEYKEGLLYFDIMNKEVWNKASEDSTGLKQYYQKVKDNYIEEGMMDAVLIAASTDSLRNATISKFYNELNTTEEREKAFNNTNTQNIQVSFGEFTKEELAKYPEATGGIGKYFFEKDGKFYYIEIIKALDPKPRALKKIKGLIISEYQKELEKNWLKTLKAKYKVSIDEKQLDKVIKALENPNHI